MCFFQSDSMVVKFFVCISPMFLLIWKVGGYSTSYPNGYTTYTFTSSESFTPSFDIHANVLIVGGGGGGGNSLVLALAGSGGGGAGGLGYGQRIFYAGQSYSISIGQGGSPGVNGGTTSINGNQVSENAYGGGYGGQDLGLVCYTGSSGASGGGGCGNAVGGGSSGPGNGNLQYLGNSGGSGNQFGSGGGGGGAGGGGGVSGGSGFQWNINGQYYASGGGSGNGNNCGGANICCYNAQVNTGGSGLGNDGGTPFSVLGTMADPTQAAAAVGQDVLLLEACCLADTAARESSLLHFVTLARRTMADPALLVQQAITVPTLVPLLACSVAAATTPHPPDPLIVRFARRVMLRQPGRQPAPNALLELTPFKARPLAPRVPQDTILFQQVRPLVPNVQHCIFRRILDPPLALLVPRIPIISARILRLPLQSDSSSGLPLLATLPI